jgi:hypothetical protein
VSITDGGASEDEAMKAGAGPLSIPLSTLDLSVRTSNILKNAKIIFIGELVAYTEADLLRLQNCGAKSVRELKEVVAAYGLRLGSPAGDWQASDVPAPQPMQPKRLADYDERSQAKFFLRSSDLRLSMRAHNVLLGSNIKFVGELAQKSAAQVSKLQNCGRNTVIELENLLRLLGLALGTEIADWDRKAAQAAHELPSASLETALSEAHNLGLPQIEASCLEEELCGLLVIVADERNAGMVAKLFGWAGRGRRTLESVGQEYGITRERVRQIAAKTIAKIRGDRIEKPWLTRALNAARQVGPVTPKELAKLLRKARISRTDFDPSGLESACEEFGIKFGLDKRSLGGFLVYGKEPALARLRSLYRLCKKLSSARGCANFDAMCDELGIPESERDSARFMISKTGANEWLDDDQRWLISKTATRNRLTNILSKVLYVCPNIALSELRRAAAKSRRLQSVPPTKVLARFLEVRGLATVSSNEVRATGTFDGVIEPGSAEATMLKVLRAHGSVLRWDRFHELCIAEGLNPTTAGIYMSISPIISRVARGIYALVGTKIEPGVTEEIAADIARSRRTAAFGWTSRSTLWCAVEVSRNALTSGSVHLPNFVTNMIDGREWQIRFDGRQFGTTLKARNNFVWSLAKPLERLGAEPGDICILDFDLTASTVGLTVGGEDLVDSWESGDIDIIESNLPDADEIETEEAEEETVDELLPDGEAATGN